MSYSSPPPGISDIFPEEAPLWNLIENAARKVFALYGCGEMRAPLLEYTEVFKKGIGGDTEVVQKEMYTFEDKGGRSLTLRPEGTAGVMRALSGTDAMNGVERRVFYMGPMFRGERPAAGRRRQFHQIGVENVGRVAPELDAECVAMLAHFLEECGVTGTKILINTRGAVEDRAPAAAALKTYFEPQIAGMCADCKTRLEKNIWRILDCKQPQCAGVVAGVPDITSFFSGATKEYFKAVTDALKNFRIEFDVSPRLVRGLDYYVHTVFEAVHPALDNLAVAGGGRYELFIPETSKPVKGVGFAAGVERLIMSREALGVKNPEPPGTAVFLVSLGAAAKSLNMAAAAALRKAGVPVIVEVEDKSMKAQMRAADRIKAKIAVIRGDTEIAEGAVVCKDLASGEQKKIPAAELAAFIGAALSR
jgi:histidyl-tRNA synthetase